MSDLGESAVEYLEASRKSAAAALDDAARNIRSSSDTVSRAGHDAVDTVSRAGHDAADTVSRVGNDAADKVKVGAKFVRTHGAKQLVTDVETLVKQHPGKAIIAALVVGFFAARALNTD